MNEAADALKRLNLEVESRTRRTDTMDGDVRTVTHEYTSEDGNVVTSAKISWTPHLPRNNMIGRDGRKLKSWQSKKF